MPEQNPTLQQKSVVAVIRIKARIPREMLNIKVETVPVEKTAEELNPAVVKLKEGAHNYTISRPVAPPNIEEIVDAVLKAIRPNITNEIVAAIAEAIRARLGDGEELDSIFFLEEEPQATPTK